MLIYKDPRKVLPVLYGHNKRIFSLHKQDFGDAFAEVRFRRGNEFHEDLSKVDLREAYVSAYVGPFDFKVGHQIVVWGRADSFNPTNNLTPETVLFRSPDEDDRRLANFLIRSYLNIHPLRIEVVWVPVYRASYVPLDLLTLPPGVVRGEEDYPGTSLTDGAYALRFNFEFPSFDGSLSYFNGYNPRPGISTDSLSMSPPSTPFSIFPKAYRMSVVGADFQTTAGEFGLRGEIGYRKTHGDRKAEFHIPNSDLSYVFGVDKEFSGDWTVIVQYIGRYVFDFEELYYIAIPEILPIKILEEKNRMIAGQQNEISHSFSCRAGLKLLHETLDLELVGLYNITTEEYLLKPKMDYDIADALTFTRVIVILVVLSSGFLWGGAAFRLVTIASLLGWTTDILDGIFARRATHQRKTWIGENDFNIDVALFVAIFVYLALIGIVPNRFAIAYLVVGTTCTFISRSQSVIQVFEAPIIALALYAVFREEPFLWRVVLLWILGAMTLCKERFLEVVDGFFQGLRALKK